VKYNKLNKKAVYVHSMLGKGLLQQYFQCMSLIGKEWASVQYLFKESLLT